MDAHHGPPFDVAVVGGGPVGMWLAAELHRGGVRPVVLERRAERPPYSKALTIYPRTVEQFAMRGLVDRWLAEGTPVPSSHFALLTNRLDFSFLPTRYPFTLFLPQRRTEELLEEHLAELGVPYLRRHAVTGLRQDESGVDLDVDSPGGPAVVRAAYAVGCDGAASVVRAAAGIDFEGTPDTWRTILGDIQLTDPPPTPALTLNQPGGSMYMVAIGGGRYRLAVVDHATLHDPVDKPATFAELRASALRLAGTDFGMLQTPDAWLSRVGNAARQAARYRVGRVLLAGDAAHIHAPIGGQGLNLGVQDAFNLGWKLAAEVGGWAPKGLLDSYEIERHPVAADVLNTTRAQGELLSSGPGPESVRRLVADLMDFDDVNRYLVEKFTAIGIRYDFGEGPQLLGRRMRDIGLKSGRLYALMHGGRGLVLDLTGLLSVEGWADRVDHVVDGSEELDVPAVLLRPDGHVAWIGDGQAELLTQVERWFGSPTAVTSG